MNEPAFDVIAPTYDETFSSGMTGSFQRMITRKYLTKFLKDKPPFEILEINCGTGDDANWLSSLGNKVIATDASPKMIEFAKLKYQSKNNSAIEFYTCSFNQLDKVFPNRSFDMIFSNFSGLNCASPEELEKLSKIFESLLKPGGYMALIIFGKNCWWEMFYYLWKGQPKSAFRRWNKNKVEVELTAEVKQPIYYYSGKRFLNLLNGFRVGQRKPVGLFMPPSYLEHSMQKRKSLFNFFAKLEKYFGGISQLSSFADHTFFLLKKQS